MSPPSDQTIELDNSPPIASDSIIPKSVNQRKETAYQSAT
jgi:hypothetical protein